MIEKIEACKSPFISEDDTAFNYGLDTALSIIKKLDEPEKPVVPQFCADFYESIKDDFEKSLYLYIIEFYNNADDNTDDFDDWFNDSPSPIETLVRMKLFGYEVKKEKLYRMRHKLTGEYLSQNYAKTGYYHSLDHFHILKLSKKDWEHLTVWGDSTYEIEEVDA